MTTSFVSVEHDSKISVVRIDNPKHNPLSTAVLEELAETLEELGKNPPRVVIVASKNGVFSVGADVNELVDETLAPRLCDAFRRAFDALAAFPRPTIALMKGYAVGGGCELSLACDFRVGATNLRIGFPEVGLGLFPGAGGTQRATRLIGVTATKELIYTGRLLDAQAALEIGLISMIAPPETLDGIAREFAERLAAGPPLAQQFAKQAIDQAHDLPLEEGLDLERKLFDKALASEDGKAGMASFLANGPGKATFAGR